MRSECHLVACSSNHELVNVKKVIASIQTAPSVSIAVLFDAFRLNKLMILLQTPAITLQEEDKELNYNFLFLEANDKAVSGFDSVFNAVFENTDTIKDSTKEFDAFASTEQV